MYKLIKEYVYKISIKKMIWPVLLFAGLAALFLYLAVTNDRGVLINGVISLDKGQGTIFYYCLAAVSIVFVAAGGYALVVDNSGNEGKKLKLFEDRLEYPIRKTPVQVMYADMRAINMLDIYGTKIIEITAADNKKHSLLDSKFRTKQEMEEVYSFLEDKIKAL